MSLTRRFRALSLDLGETVWWDTPELAARHDGYRAEIFASVLRGPDGRPIPVARVAIASAELRSEFTRAGRSHRTVSTRHKIEEIARRLGAHLAVSLDDTVAQYARAGLDIDPPSLNPEAVSLVKALNRVGVPVVAISNTQRTGEAWRGFLSGGGLNFEFVITSSDLEVAKPDPRLFREAAGRLSLAPQAVIHVGDRWSTDVLGALSVGMGAALYTGLWHRHWDREEGGATDPGTDPGVFRWDDLRQAMPLFLDA